MALDHRIRIIGGTLKGRKIEVMDAEGLRPTTDRVRETVFNWLGQHVVNARVLDLFAGSGALGFEAYSRGASEVVLVEKNKDNAAALIYTAKQISKNDEITVRCADALEYLKSLPKGQGFDLIFLDPPFKSDLLVPAVELLTERELLNEDALVYVEMGKNKSLPLIGLQMLRDDVVGASHFGLYQKSFFI